MLGCPRSHYSLQLGPRVLMYNLLEIKLILYQLPNQKCFCRQTTCIVLTNCGNKVFQVFHYLSYEHYLLYNTTTIWAMNTIYSMILPLSELWTLSTPWYHRYLSYEHYLLHDTTTIWAMNTIYYMTLSQLHPMMILISIY